MAKNVKMEWRQGATGDGAVYTFFPKPDMDRPESGLKQAEFDIPLSDGVLIQDLGHEKRIITLTGTLVSGTNVFEDLEDKRLALINGVGFTEGQLHLISVNTSLVNKKHIYYRGQISPEGVVFAKQTTPRTLEYEIRIICADPVAYSFFSQSQTITSNAKVS